MSTTKKIISIILSVLMLVGIFSAATPVFAADVREKENVTATLQEIKNDSENDAESEILAEIVSGRDKYTKVFANTDGTKTAVISATPIHYETENGWEDIDNTLIEQTEDQVKVYKNKNNSFTATIPKELSSDKKVKIEKDEYSISFELKGTDVFKNNEKSKGTKQKKIKNAEKLENGMNTEFLNKNSGVIFEDIGENTDIEYEVTSTGLKENIILSEKPNGKVTYNYEITAKKLQGVLNADKSVTFTTSDGQAVFRIPAPVMYDAESTMSTDIDVSFSGKNGKYILTYTPSYEWLSGEIKYPVVIDPVIDTVNEKLGIIDTYADSSEPSTNYGYETALAVFKTTYGEQISYLSLSSNLITHSGVKIKSVTMSVYYSLGIFIDDSVEIGAYPITSKWLENTVTYNNKPTTGTLVDRKIVDSSKGYGYLSFDVTKAYTSGDIINGIALKQTEDSNGTALLVLNSSEHSTTSQHPYFVIEYYESQGVEEQFDYHAYDAGRAGMVYFNDFTEQIYIERDELGLSGINMPVQIKRYFNTGLGGTYSPGYFELYTLAAFYGFGWRTNYNQHIEYHNEIDGKEHILYCNGNGQTTYFAKTDTVDSSGIRTWEEVSDTFSNSDGYTLYLPSEYEGSVANNLQYATIKDSSGQTYEFNSSGLLLKINSADAESENSITVNYTSNGLAIDKIIDGSGREYRFSYTEYEDYFFPLLTSIQVFAPSGSAITVTNDSGTKVPYKISYTYSFVNYTDKTVPFLTSATYPDGETVYYSVSDRLMTIQNIDGYAVQFLSYSNGVGISELVYTEDSETPVNGGELKIVTTNTPYEKSCWDPNNVIQTKQFDLYGRVINVINGDGTNVPRTYSDDVTTRGQIYYGLYVDYEQDLETQGTNLISNGDFTTNLGGWTALDSSNVARTEEYDCNADTNTPGSLQITGERDVNYVTQTVSIEKGMAGDEYRFDYNIKSGNSHNNMYASYLSIVLIEARNNVEGDESWTNVAWVDANPFNGNWQNYSYAFDIDFEYNEIRVTLAYYFQYGKVRYDDISLVNTYKATVSESSGSGTDSDTDTESGGSSETDKCTCDGCITPDCPCRECSDTCAEPACNRGYSFENDSDGSSFTITDGVKEMSMSQVVDGNYYGSQTDINGIYTGYNYDQKNGQLKSMSDGNDNVTSFSYDAMSRLNKVSNSVEGLTSGNKMETSYNYEDDRIESITHNGFSYNYEYDAWGNPTSVKVGEQSLVSYTYGEKQNRDRVNRITYGNGDYTDYSYTADGNIDEIKSYSADSILTAHYLYTYGEYRNVEKITNILENTEVRYTDTGTSFVDLNGAGDADDKMLYSTGVNENSETVEILGEIEYTETDGEVENDPVTGTTTVSSSVIFDDNSRYTYDLMSRTDYFGRNEMDKFSMLYDYNEGYELYYGTETEYGYKDIPSTNLTQPDKTTSLVSSYKNTLCFDGVILDESKIEAEIPDDTNIVLHEYEYLYDYDYNGNITRVRLKTVDSENVETITELNSYVYDEVGQLVRENNAEINKTYVYVYDKGGNIAQKIEYTYTTGTLGEPVSTVNYTYDSAWKDRLTAYSDTQIQTDAMGNPLNYTSINYAGETVNGTLEWNGRQLVAVNQGNKRYEYSYNSDGLRTSVKTYSNNAPESIQYYIWQNGKLMGYFNEDKIGSNDTSVKMLYDNNDDLIGFRLVNEQIDYDKVLFFRKNLQGDIQSVYDSFGNQVLTYTYDAWGNVTVTANTDSTQSTISAAMALNYVPITYRGYMYDANTGLYYLQSRYYNPTYGRFLNADSIMKTGEPLGANIFAYCGNNPVNYIDPYGYSSSSVINLIVEIIVILIALDAVMRYLFDDVEIDKVGKLKQDFNGIYSLKMRYITEEADKEWLTLEFGDYNAWGNSSHLYNENTAMYFDAQTEFIYSEGQSIAMGLGGEPYAIMWADIALLGEVIVFSAMYSPYKKIFKTIWGEDGLDPENRLMYYAYRVTDDKRFNGAYAFSFVNGKWKELDI